MTNILDPKIAQISNISKLFSIFFPLETLHVLLKQRNKINILKAILFGKQAQWMFADPGL